jgi:hypoxia-inducible factor (prolyl hydroxylase)
MERGYSITDNFVGKETAALLRKALVAMYKRGEFEPSQVGGGRTGDGKDTKTAAQIRGDKVVHLAGDAVLTGDDENGGFTFLLQPLLANFDTVLGVAARQIGELRGISERSKCMAAVYPASGTQYVRHIDNPDLNGRKLTVLYYLNLDWQGSDGGELRLFGKRGEAKTLGGGGAKQVHSKGEKHVDIEPLADRLVTFWSDGRTPHAVLPSFKVREHAACSHKSKKAPFACSMPKELFVACSRPVLWYLFLPSLPPFLTIAISLGFSCFSWFLLPTPGAHRNLNLVSRRCTIA